MSDPWSLAALVGYATAVAAANLFVVAYALLARWWKTQFGQHLFIFMFVIALVLDHGVIQLIVQDYPGRFLVRVILNWAVAGILIWRLGILLVVQIKGRGDARNPETNEKVPRGRYGFMGDSNDPDSPVVERVDPLGGSDERLG